MASKKGLGRRVISGCVALPVAMPDAESGIPPWDLAPGLSLEMVLSPCAWGYMIKYSISAAEGVLWFRLTWLKVCWRNP